MAYPATCLVARLAVYTSIHISTRAEVRYEAAHRLGDHSTSGHPPPAQIALQPLGPSPLRPAAALRPHPCRVRPPLAGQSLLDKSAQPYVARIRRPSRR